MHPPSRPRLLIGVITKRTQAKFGRASGSVARAVSAPNANRIGHCTLSSVHWSSAEADVRISQYRAQFTHVPQQKEERVLRRRRQHARETACKGGSGWGRGIGRAGSHTCTGVVWLAAGRTARPNCLVRSGLCARCRCNVRLRRETCTPVRRRHIELPPLWRLW